MHCPASCFRFYASAIAATFLFVTPTVAATESYKCVVESGTVFGAEFDFTYDTDANVILLDSYAGGPYSHNLTLGNVRQADGVLDFSLEFWDDGFVAVRESYRLKLEKLQLEARHSPYDANHMDAGRVYTALGACYAVEAAVSSPANEWVTTTGQDDLGLAYASLRTERHEFALEFRCDEHDADDNLLGVRFSAISLPRLYAQAEMESRLSLLFTLPGGAVYRERMDARYVAREPEGAAWHGAINAGKSELDAIAAARSIDILNQDGELAYRFAAAGTGEGVAAIEKICKLGAD